MAPSIQKKQTSINLSIFVGRAINIDKGKFDDKIPLGVFELRNCWQLAFPVIFCLQTDQTILL